MTEWIIIDGYNLIYRMTAGFGHNDLDRLRGDLIRQLEPLVNLIAKRITVVFDGASRPLPPAPPEIGPVEVIFSPAGKSADTVIENLVWKSGRPGAILVVTSDRMERDGAGATGADTMASSVFIEIMREYASHLRHEIGFINKRGASTTIGDFFPPKQS